MIPKEFYLAGRKWRVVEVELTDDHGQCDTNSRIIRLNSEDDRETQEDTFCHELIHALKFTLGWKDNRKNHHECDSLGGLLLQFLKTKKGQL